MNREVCPSCDAVVPVDLGRFMAHYRVIVNPITWTEDINPQDPSPYETCPSSGRLVREP